MGFQSRLAALCTNRNSLQSIPTLTYSHDMVNSYTSLGKWVKQVKKIKNCQTKFLVARPILVLVINFTLESCRKQDKIEN